MQSHGGVAPIAEPRRLAAGAVLSGPAGGVAGEPATPRGCSASGNLITFDMGGTSTDIALSRTARPQLTADEGGRRQQVALPELDIHTLGRRRRLDRPRRRRRHPARRPGERGRGPGPACYGRGGTAATVTDANLVLG